MPQPKVGTRIRFVERRNHPQVLDGLGTHKQTYQERIGGLITEIRQKMPNTLFALLVMPMTGIT
jgi:hypothetical protein